MSVNATTTTTGNAPSNGLKGITPTIFNGDRSRSDEFLNELRQYWRNDNSISTPFDRVLIALSYIRGPIVDDWVNAQENWLETRINPTTLNHVMETDEVLWTEFESAFKSAWKDTAQSAYHQLMKLSMKGLDIDTYTTTFERLAAAVEWEPNAMGTIALYRAGLQDSVHYQILDRENIPVDMDEWKDVARKEVNRIREKQKAGLSRFHGSQRLRDQGPYQSNQRQQSTTPRNNSNNRIVPIVDTTTTTQSLPLKKLTDEERAQYRAEGRCFRCRTKGHMARNCPKNTNRQAHTRATDTTTTTASNSTISTTKTTPSVATPNLTRAQQIRALEDSMTEDERSAYLAARDMGKDFCSAEL